MNKFFGLSCILLSFSLLSGCVTEKIVYENGREVVKTDDDDSPERSKLAADNRVKIAIRLLNEGQATMAKQNLQKALVMSTRITVCSYAARRSIPRHTTLLNMR